MAIRARRFLAARTRRVVLVLLVAVGLYLLAITPARTYLDQRHQMAAAEERYELLAEHNVRLEERVARLRTDDEIARLARERYELVPPGQQAYAVMPTPASPASPPAPRQRDGWWSTLADAVTFWN